MGHPIRPSHQSAGMTTAHTEKQTNKQTKQQTNKNKKQKQLQ